MLVLAFGCSVGVGEGELTGVITDPVCGLEGAAVDVGPNFFVADDDRDGVVIRVQKGGDFLVLSDGLSIAVADAAREVGRLGTPVEVGPEGDVRMTFHYNHTCGFDRDRSATVLTAVEGTITFDALWAPEVDGDQLESSASFSGVRFVDLARPDERFAVLDGWFRFFFNRGRPAQRYP
ncbi:MAG: hypothetical protein H6722_23780 [Sandaracinus sp.]|nr:hypothetical protein [Myxococcales bacterium]MCB9615464.1 hypothetical protein [Sandaracinus sp.]